MKNTPEVPKYFPRMVVPSISPDSDGIPGRKNIKD